MSAQITPELSVVVCSHNGGAKLSIALDSLMAQTMSTARFEVLVIDDGSTDNTSAVAAEYQGVRVIRLEQNVGLAAARNAGVRAAGGRVVAFTDDDCAVDPGWASALQAGFEDDSVEGVSGPVTPESRSGFVRRFLTYANPLAPLGAELLVSSSLSYRLWLYVRDSVGQSGPMNRLYSVVGANMAFRRAVLYEIGGFDEAFRFGAEEEDLCRRLNARDGGAQLIYLPRAVVTHWFEDRITDSFRRSRAYGRGNARSRLKHPEVRAIVYPAPVLLATGLTTGLVTRRPGLMALALLTPLVGYPAWLVAAIRRRSVEPAVYPYLQVVQELFGMIGQLEGTRAGYQWAETAQL